MNGVDKKEFVRICIWYRGLSVLFSTAAYMYLLFAYPRGKSLWIGLVAALGMITACAVGTFLYRRFLMQEEETAWFIPVFSMELMAYGIFVVLSGGLASPYLWYCVGCIFLTMTQERYKILTVLSLLWCLLCVGFSYIQGYHVAMLNHLALNMSIAVLSVVGGFHVLFIYIQRLNQSRTALAQERDRSEQALRQVIDLYDAIHLFAITDADRVIQELALLLQRTTTVSGCLLIKLDEEQRAELTGSSGFSQEEVCHLTALALDGPIRSAGERLDGYEVKLFENGMHPLGLLIFSGQLPKISGEAPAFYNDLTESILRSIEIQKYVESYIVSEEQNRIAQEIHDTILQRLFAAACSVKVLEVGLEELSQDRLRNTLQELEISLKQTMQELREAIYDLRFEQKEVFLDKLTDYMEELKRVNGVRIQLDIAEESETLTVSQKTAAYRIFCEAANNAVRHGHAEHVEAKLQMDAQEVSISVTDDGCGFDVTSSSEHQGGLKNMHQLAAFLKGQLTIESHKRKGTCIQVCFPR